MNIKSVITDLVSSEKAIGINLGLPKGRVEFEFKNNSALRSIASSVIEAVDLEVEYFYLLIMYNDKNISLYKDKNRKVFVLATPERDIMLPFGTESFKSFEEAIRDL